MAATIQYLVGTYMYNLMPIVLLIDQADFYIDVWSPWGHKKKQTWLSVKCQVKWALWVQWSKTDFIMLLFWCKALQIEMKTYTMLIIWVFYDMSTLIFDNWCFKEVKWHSIVFVTIMVTYASGQRHNRTAAVYTFSGFVPVGYAYTPLMQ